VHERKVVTGKVLLRWICEGHPPVPEDPMTEDRMALTKLLRKSGKSDFLRALASRCCRSWWKQMSIDWSAPGGTSAPAIGYIIGTAIETNSRHAPNPPRWWMRVSMRCWPTWPSRGRTKLHSTNPRERLYKEVKRRADVVGIFPNEASITRLIGAVLLEQNNEVATPASLHANRRDGRTYTAADRCRRRETSTHGGM